MHPATRRILFQASALALALAAGTAAAQGLRPGARGTGLPPASGTAGTAAATASTTPQQADYIVAVVNSEPVTNNEVRARVARALQQFAQQGVRPPPAAELNRLALERLITERAQVQEARERNIRVDETAIDQAEEGVARQYSTDVATLRRRLAADNVPLAQFRDELRSQLLIQRLREREVEQRVRVTEADIDAYLREQQAAPQAGGGNLNLGHVLVRVPENASAADIAALQAKAQRAAERARGGEDFAAVARDSSDAPEGKAGGTLGLRPADRYPQLFLDAVAQVPNGGIAGPVRSPAGFHVLKVIERQAPGLPGSTVTQTRVRHILLRVSPAQTETQAAARLADYKRRLQAGTGEFTSLAREHSQDGSAKEGGDLGWTNPGTFVPEFEEVVNELAAGEVSDPVVSRYGVHLIQVVGRREAQLTPREQREMVRGAVREKKLDEAYAAWVQELRGRAYVEVRSQP